MAKPYHNRFLISGGWEKGVGYTWLTGLELNGEGHVLACWDTKEENALEFPTEAAATKYIMPMIRDGHPSVRSTRIIGMMSDYTMWKYIGDRYRYHKAMSVIG